MANINLSNFLRVKFLRFLPKKMHGKNKLARILLEKYLSQDDYLIQDEHGCLFRVPSLKESIAFNLLINGCYESLLLHFLLNYLKSGDAFLDIGANIGVFSLPCSSKVGEDGRVIAVEPANRAFLFLKENIVLNKLNNIHLYNCAAALNNEVELDFYEAPKETFGLSSFFPEANFQSIRVLTCSIDTILEKEGISTVKVIKADVEGYEAKVFLGASKLLSQSNAPLIAFEFSPIAEGRLPNQKIGDSQRVLLDFGYRIWKLDNFLKKRKPEDAVLIDDAADFIAVKQQ